MSTTCAEVIVQEISHQGIDTVFGIPGVHTLGLYRALAVSDLRHVTPRHEQSAAFMADGFARAGGAPAACVLITGPGLLNATTAIGQAWSDSIPMLVLATGSDRSNLGLGRGSLHDMPDQLAALRGLLQMQALRLHSAEQSVPAVRMLMADMQLRRPRPTYLEIPLDIAAEQMPNIAPQRSTKLGRSGPDPEAIQSAAKVIQDAKRPVIIAGGGARGAAAAVRNLVKQTGAVIITTVAGRGIVSESEGHSLGATLSMPVTRAVINEADLVIAIGTQLGSTDHYQRVLSISPPMIRIDIDPHELTRDHPPLVGILSDARLAVEAVSSVLANNNERPCWRDDCIQMLAHMRETWRNEEPDHTRILDALFEATPAETIIASDMTQIAYTGNVYFPSSAGSQWLHPSGFGTLGYGLPAAIGAKLALPERCVVSLSGDYGVGFTLAELATAVDLRMGLPVIIWNNGGLAQIADDMDRKKIPQLGVNIPSPDFASLAKGYGAAYRKPEKLSQLDSIIAHANADTRPTVIELSPQTLS